MTLLEQLDEIAHDLGLVDDDGNRADQATILRRIRTLDAHQEDRDAALDVLGARPGESLADAARRVVGERDAAQAGLGNAIQTMVSLADSFEYGYVGAAHFADEIRNRIPSANAGERTMAKVETLTAELAQAKAERDRWRSAACEACDDTKAEAARYRVTLEHFASCPLWYGSEVRQRARCALLGVSHLTEWDEVDALWRERSEEK